MLAVWKEGISLIFLGKFSAVDVSAAKPSLF